MIFYNKKIMFINKNILKNWCKQKKKSYSSLSQKINYTLFIS